jgi:hypothetical protein
MRFRNASLSFALLVTLPSFTFSTPVAAQGTWAVEKTLHIGGEGGWDYVTLDANAHRLYVPRSTRTMVIDVESGKTIADIPGQKHNHGVALVPSAGRGFISDGAGAIVIFDLKTNAVWAPSQRKPMPTALFSTKPAGLCWSSPATAEF